MAELRKRLEERLRLLQKAKAEEETKVLVFANQIFLLEEMLKDETSGKEEKAETEGQTAEAETAKGKKKGTETQKAG